MINPKKKFELKSYTKKELRHLLGVPNRTFLKWIKPYREQWGIGRQKYLTIAQVKLIVEKFGMPGEMEVN